MNIGTGYFKSFSDAYVYYAQHNSFDVRSLVMNRLNNKEIFIGKPPLQEGQECYLDNDGRYWIKTVELESEKKTEEVKKKPFEEFDFESNFECGNDNGYPPNPTGGKCGCHQDCGNCEYAKYDFSKLDYSKSEIGEIEVIVKDDDLHEIKVSASEEFCFEDWFDEEIGEYHCGISSIRYYRTGSKKLNKFELEFEKRKEFQARLWSSKPVSYKDMKPTKESTELNVWKSKWFGNGPENGATTWPEESGPTLEELLKEYSKLAGCIEKDSASIGYYVPVKNTEYSVDMNFNNNSANSTEGEKKMNTAINKTLEEMNVLLLAPGANKENTTIRTDSKSRKVIVESKPEAPSTFEVDLAVNESVIIPEEYNIENVKVTIVDGVILIKFSVNEKQIKTVEIS